MEVRIRISIHQKLDGKNDRFIKSDYTDSSGKSNEMIQTSQNGIFELSEQHLTSVKSMSGKKDSNVAVGDL
jgi:hypothetical protein